MSLPAYIKQESKYHNLLKQIVNELDLTPLERERVETELEIIHYSCSSKHVYALYLLTQRCKKDRQYYVLRGAGSDTLLFYVLGISNINPNSKVFKKPLPYQIALGTMEDPKRMGDEIQVSASYRKKLHKYLIECFLEDSDFYRVIDLENGIFKYNQFKTVLIPKGADPNGYGDYLKAYGKEGFLSCFRDQKNVTKIVILSFFEMPNIDLMYEDIESKQFKNRYISFLKTISNIKRVKDGSFVFGDKYINLKKEKFDTYKNNFIEFCLDVCRQINLDKGMTRDIIRCREDIWNILDKLDLSDDEKYDLYKNVYSDKFHRLGLDSIIKNKYKSKHKQIIKELYDARYTFPLGHIIGFVKQDIDSINDKN